MIDLQYRPAANRWKVSITLEECGMPHTLCPVNNRRGGQFRPGLLAISPNNRMPASVDHDPPGGAKRARGIAAGCAQVRRRR